MPGMGSGMSDEAVHALIVAFPGTAVVRTPRAVMDEVARLREEAKG